MLPLTVALSLRLTMTLYRPVWGVGAVTVIVRPAVHQHERTKFIAYFDDGTRASLVRRYPTAVTASPATIHPARARPVGSPRNRSATPLATPTGSVRVAYEFSTDRPSLKPTFAVTRALEIPSA